MMVFTPTADCNLEDLIATASEREPLLLFFHSTFCGPSNLMKPLIYEVAAEYPRAAFYIIDVETFPAITRKYAIKGTPAMVLVQDNQPIASRLGTMSFDDIWDFIDNEVSVG